MTRHTVDSITSDALDALYDELAALRAVARGYCPACGRGDAAPSVDDWEQQRQRAETAEHERDEARQHAAAIAAQRDRLRQRMNTLADRWDLEGPPPGNRPLTELRAEISVAPFDPEGAMTVQEYTERGRRLWAFRCWGTDTCDGWLGLGHHTQSSALLERDRHVAEEHAAPTQVVVNPPGSTVEQLPSHVLALLPTHPYLSTACQTADAVAITAVRGLPLYDELRAHAERLHARCRLNHKFTGQLCTCGCHPEPAPVPATAEATDTTKEQP